MPTKKVVKKISAKKVKSSKTVKVNRAREVVAASPVSEVFSTSPQTETTVEVPANSVALYVNGRSKGVVHTEGQKLGDFVVSTAQREGITSFSVYIDGVKSTTADKGRAMSQMSKIEIVSKDSRGSLGWIN